MHFDNVEFEVTYASLEGEAEIDVDLVAEVAHQEDEALELFQALIVDKPRFESQCREALLQGNFELVAAEAHAIEEAFELFQALIVDREEFQDQCREELGETTLTVQKVIQWITGEGPRAKERSPDAAKALVQALVQRLIEVGVISPLPEWLQIKLPKVGQ